jgi:histidine triad (HIT) family protein
LLSLIKTMSACKFCEIVKGTEPAHIIWQDNNFLAFLNVPPRNPGHSVIIPKHHVESVFGLIEPLYTEFFQAAKNLYAPLKEAVKMEIVAVNLGTIGCGHVHINLIPVNDEDMRHPHGPIKMDEEQLTEIAEKIRNEIAGNLKAAI